MTSDYTMRPLLPWAVSKLVVTVIALVLGWVPARVAADELRMGGTGSALVLLERLGAAFAADGGNADSVSVLPSLGSGGGVAAARDGAIDLAVSARALTDTERAGGLREAPFLRTPLILVTSRQSPPGLTRAELPALHARPDATWPDGVPLRLILRSPSESAVAILADSVPGLAPAIAAARQHRYIPVAGTDQENFAFTRSTPGSLSVALLVQLRTEGEALAAVPLDGITPTLATFEAGDYRLAMELRVVVAARANSVTKRFVAFLRSARAAEIVREAGAVPLALPAEL